MRKISLLLAVLLLSACDKPMPFESAGALAENPERLKELRLQCRNNRAELGEAQCNAVSDALRIRFMGKGTPQCHQLKEFSYKYHIISAKFSA
ncbi:EexN family lipoprotein [Ectopseudomonas mendocina]